MAGSPLGHPAIEAHSSRASRWLRERRLRLALWIAVLEGIVVAVRGDISRWTVVVIAGLVLLVYMALRDRLHWDAGRQILWVVAASQVGEMLNLGDCPAADDANLQTSHRSPPASAEPAPR